MEGAAAAADVRMRWKRRKRRETTFAWRLEEAARAMLAMGPNVEDMRVARAPGRTSLRERRRERRIIRER